MSTEIKDKDVPARAAKMDEQAEEAPEEAGPGETAAEAPHFSLRISPDQVSVLLDCPDPLANLDTILDRIMKEFEELHLPQFPDRDLTREIIESAATPGGHLVRHAVIVGQSPTPPQPGRLAWSRDFFVAGWAVDGDDCMDFWEPLERRAVSAGEVVCRVLPPEPGVPGLNVYGKEISVPTLKAAKLRAGKHTIETQAEDGVRVITAECDGRLRHAKDTVQVDDIYVIKGDVSLETGNIHHKGAVTIHGDVRSGAVIETDGDVAVRGLVEASTIHCGGDLVVGGGIVGDGEGEVIAGGGVEALYISETRVRAGGDVVVKNEIAHADIECRGKVRACKGRIAGGRTLGLKGIRVAEAGAGGSTTTLLVAGFDPDLEPALLEHRTKLVRLDEARKALVEALAKHGELPPEKAKALAHLRTELQDKLANIDESHEEVLADMTALKEAAGREVLEEIAIYEEIWSGTTVQLCKWSMYVRASVHKPRLVGRNRKNLKLLPMGEGNTPED
ncbi:MAG: DUF342 domain-containing protein [bacterium]|nr:DUF342 domain-containing protein [bacterium]